MEFAEKLNSLSLKILQQGSAILTEEATKNAFVMPFIHGVLGYDVFDPVEVVPEFICDVGTKKGEKIDYAIINGDQIQILIECKKIGEPLSVGHASQLFRYFHATTARIAILTNGQVYKFFTDLDAPNKMDEKPFLELDLLDIDEHVVPELLKLTKGAFDVDSIINAAGGLKYVSQIKKLLSGLLTSPDEDFIKFVASRVYDGVVTQKVREQFTDLTKRAAVQFLNDQANERLKSAINGSLISAAPARSNEIDAGAPEPADEDKVVTTVEEIEGFMIVKAIVRNLVEARRVAIRDAQSYCSVLMDDNNRKPICRMHFNRSQKYLGVFDSNKNETKIAIETVDDIYEHSDQLIAAVQAYL